MEPSFHWPSQRFLKIPIGAFSCSMYNLSQEFAFQSLPALASVRTGREVLSI